MREVSEAEFMRYVVSELDQPIYRAWEAGVYAGGMPMGDVLNMMVRILFIEDVKGSVADYVREIAIAQRAGALKWVS